MPGEGDLAGFLGGMVRGRLEEMAAGRVEQFAGREAFGQMTPQQMQQMPEYFKSGAPYGPTREGMMRWINERAAATNAAAAEAPRQAEATPPPTQAAQPAVSKAVSGARIRSFAEHEQIRSFAEHEQIRGFGDHR